MASTSARELVRPGSHQRIQLCHGRETLLSPVNSWKIRDYGNATGRLGLESQSRGSEMGREPSRGQAERHRTRSRAMFPGISRAKLRIGPGCLATVSRKPEIPFLLHVDVWLAAILLC